MPRVDAAWAAVGLTALGMLVTAAGWTWRRVWRLLRRLGEFLDDWRGEDARPGVPRRPGVPERVERIERRLGTVEAEMKPDHGASMRDAVDRVERSISAHLHDPNAHPKGRS